MRRPQSFVERGCYCAVRRSGPALLRHGRGLLQIVYRGGARQEQQRVVLCTAAIDWQQRRPLCQTLLFIVTRTINPTISTATCASAYAFARRPRLPSRPAQPFFYRRFQKLANCEEPGRK